VAVHLNIANLGLWLVAILQGLAICVLLYRQSNLQTPRTRLSIGSRAPTFRAVDLESEETVELENFTSARLFVLFVTPGCHYCNRLVAGLKSIGGLARRDELVVYCNGPRSACESVGGASGSSMLISDGSDAMAAFGLTASPAMVELDDSRRIVGYSYPMSTVDVMAAISDDLYGPEVTSRSTTQSGIED